MRPLGPLGPLAIFVGIVLCIAILLLIEASIGPEIQKFQQKIDTVQPGDGLADIIDHYHSLQIFRAIVWGLNLVTIAVLVVCLINLTTSEDD